MKPKQQQRMIETACDLALVLFWIALIWAVLH